MRVNDGGEIEFDRIGTEDDPRFAALMALYEAGIPERERKSRSSIEAMLNSTSHRLVVASLSGQVIGFFILYVGQRIALLEYLTTAAHVRGHGLGGALYRQVRLTAGALPLLVEVETDREPAVDRDMRARRIEFYRRLGCRRVMDFNFVLPLAGDGPPPRLDILVDGVTESIARDQLAGWIREIYQNVYGCSAEDPRLLGMVDNLPGRPELL